MRLVHYVMIVALLFCGSHQSRMISNHRNSGLGQTGTRLKSGIPGSNGYNSGTGPYDIVVQLIHLCNKPGLNMVNAKMEAYNTKTNGVSKILYRGNFTVPFTKEQLDTLDIKLRIYRVKDNKEFLLVKYDDNMCKTWAGPGKETYVEVQKMVGLEGDQCVIPEGFYSFSDWDVKVTLPPPVLEYGAYKATIEFLYNQQIIACLEGNGIVKQKI